LAKAVDELNAVQAKTPAGMVRRGQERLAGVSTSNPALGILNSGGGQGNTTNFNMTVNAGMGTDADQVAREIIDVLKSYERANGVIPLITEYQVAV
jgi:hypothetical protein